MQNSAPSLHPTYQLRSPLRIYSKDRFQLGSREELSFAPSRRAAFAPAGGLDGCKFPTLVREPKRKSYLRQERPEASIQMWSLAENVTTAYPVAPR